MVALDHREARHVIEHVVVGVLCLLSFAPVTSSTTSYGLCGVRLNPFANDSSCRQQASRRGKMLNQSSMVAYHFSNFPCSIASCVQIACTCFSDSAQRDATLHCGYRCLYKPQWIDYPYMNAFVNSGPLLFACVGCGWRTLWVFPCFPPAYYVLVLQREGKFQTCVGFLLLHMQRYALCLKLQAKHKCCQYQRSQWQQSYKWRILATACMSTSGRSINR